MQRQERRREFIGEGAGDLGTGTAFLEGEQQQRDRAEAAAFGGSLHVGEAAGAAPPDGTPRDPRDRAGRGLTETWLAGELRDSRQGPGAAALADAGVVLGPAVERGEELVGEAAVGALMAQQPGGGAGGGVDEGLAGEVIEGDRAHAAGEEGDGIRADWRRGRCHSERCHSERCHSEQCHSEQLRGRPRAWW